MDGQVLMHTDELVTQSYSSYHKAIDVVGTGHSIDDVIAVSDGTVEIAVSTVTTNNQRARGTASYGNFVKIKHNDGTKSLYAHLKPGSVSVKAGDYVTEGSKIGTMGNTGNAHGVHLHFEVRNPDESRVNPINYMANKKQEETVSETKPDNNVNNSSNDEKANDVSIPSKNDSPTENVITSRTSNEALNTSNSVSNNIPSSNTVSNEIETSYLDNSSYKYGSIVDGLKGIGIDSSFDYRTELAHVNGISDYHGTYSQNVYLLGLLKSGKLKKA